MTISTPTFEASYEFDSALNQEVSLFLEQAKINFRQANSLTTEGNPITTFSQSNIFGVVAAGGSQRNFTIAVTVTETDGATPNSGVLTD